MRTFLAGFITETNTFCPRLTTFSDFQNCGYSREFSENDESFWVAPLGRFYRHAEKHGWTCFKSLCATAMPSGPIVQSVYEELRNQLLEDLKAHLPLDVVFLHLHGATVAQDISDCEGDLLSQIRALVGPHTIISALLDPHTHLTRAMEVNANILVWMKEYPHTDGLVCTDHIFELVKRTVDGEIKPTSHSFDCKTIGLFPTQEEPMKSFVARIRQLEKECPKVLSISPIHGFPWGDVPDMGSRIWVTTDNDPVLARQLSESLGNQFATIARNTKLSSISVSEMIKICNTATYDSPLVFADYADNVGGGAAGDSTFILSALLEREIPRFALSAIWDPIAVEIAMAAGEGACITLRVGGKMGPQSGAPVDLTATVTAICPNLEIAFAHGSMKFGNSVALKIEALDAYCVINDVRCQTYSTDCFTKLGIDPSLMAIIVVKSSTHFRASFEEVSNNIYIVATPGALNPDFRSIVYQHVRSDLIGLPSASDEKEASLTELVTMPHIQRVQGCSKSDLSM